MVNFEDKKSTRNVPLIAVWKDNQVMSNSNREGKTWTNAVFLDVQIDQSQLSVDDIKAGKGLSDPHLGVGREYRSVHGYDGVGYGVHYWINQLKDIQSAGTTVDMGDTHACAFTANVFPVPDRGGLTLVMTPKEVQANDTPEVVAKKEKFNSFNQVKPCGHEFTVEDFKRHQAVTRAVGLEQQGKEWSVPELKSVEKLKPTYASKERRDLEMNVPLVAVWQDKDVKYDKAGQFKGAYVDMQIDQALYGQNYSSPSVSYSNTKNPDSEHRKEYYSKVQLDKMLSAGTQADVGSIHGISFTATVWDKMNKETGDHKSIVLLPKDPSLAKSAMEARQIDDYNKIAVVSESQHENFGPNELKQQFDITREIRLKTQIPEKTEKVSSKGLDFNAGPSEPAVEQEDFVEFA